MAAPDYVPVALGDRPRESDAPIPPDRWVADRPADLHGPQPTGHGLGRPGPDQGYALVLARRLDAQLALAGGERRQDVVTGCLGLALRRAALFGRAPVIHDLDLAYSLFGFLPGPAATSVPDDLVALRRPLFQGAAHDYARQREIADLVPDVALRLTPNQVRELVVAGSWRELLGSSSARSRAAGASSR